VLAIDAPGMADRILAPMKHPDSNCDCTAAPSRWRYGGGVLSVARMRSWRSRSSLRFATGTRL